MVDSFEMPEPPSINSLMLSKIYNSAYKLFLAKMLDHAEVLCHAITSIDSNNYEALLLLGIISENKGQLQSSYAYLSKALNISPSNVEVQNNFNIVKSRLINNWIDRAVELHLANSLEEAAIIYRMVLNIDPHNVSALHLIGAYESQRGNKEVAIIYFDKAIALKPDYAEAHNNRGNALNDIQRYEEALADYEKAIALKPDYAEAYCNRGNVLNVLNRHDEALADYEKAIALKPDYAEAYCNRGKTLSDFRRYEDALADYGKAIEINPSFAGAYSNRGNVLNALNRNLEALADYDKAIALKPDYAEAYCNRGNALKALNRNKEALENYDKAIALKPNLADAHWNESYINLLLGDFERGWKKYEWRWIAKSKGKGFRHTSIPLWIGEKKINGKTILLWSEQGLGDTIQFCRFVKHVSLLGAKVILEVPSTLVDICSHIDGADRIVAIGDPLPEVNYQCPLLSLPLALKLSLQDITGKAYLKSQRDKHWANTISPNASIGIAWTGKASHANNLNRSIPLSKFTSLLPREINAVSLQKEISSSDLENLMQHKNIQIICSHLDDFSDTAALIDKLDLIVTADTAVAHLAGAMGKDVWILLPYSPDWRWLLDRNDSPWYDSATLFRQSKIGDWDSVLNEVHLKLCKRYGLQ